MKYTALKSGLYAGAINLVLVLILFILGPGSFANMWTGILTMLLSIAILVIFPLMHRKEIGGYWSFGEAFKFILIMSVIILVCSTLTNLVLFKLVDPEFMNKVKEISIDNTIKMLEGFGSPEDAISKAVEGIEKQFADQQTPMGYLMGVVKGLAIFAVLGAIIALIIKKNKPEFA